MKLTKRCKSTTRSRTSYLSANFRHASIKNRFGLRFFFFTFDITTINSLLIEIYSIFTWSLWFHENFFFYKSQLNWSLDETTIIHCIILQKAYPIRMCYLHTLILINFLNDKHFHKRSCARNTKKKTIWWLSSVLLNKKYSKFKDVWNGKIFDG